jgi:hypothetical protein
LPLLLLAGCGGVGEEGEEYDTIERAAAVGTLAEFTWTPLTAGTKMAGIGDQAQIAFGMMVAAWNKRVNAAQGAISTG